MMNCVMMLYFEDSLRVFPAHRMPFCNSCFGYSRSHLYPGMSLDGFVWPDALTTNQYSGEIPLEDWDLDLNIWVLDSYIATLINESQYRHLFIVYLLMNHKTMSVLKRLYLLRIDLFKLNLHPQTRSMHTTLIYYLHKLNLYWLNLHKLIPISIYRPDLHKPDLCWAYLHKPDPRKSDLYLHRVDLYRLYLHNIYKWHRMKSGCNIYVSNAGMSV